MSDPVDAGRVRSMRVACDSLVALGNSTADGSVLFAKNSDRPADECQPLVQVDRQAHTAGLPLRCQYIEIPQVAETAAVIGSQPFWLWGFEHGLNEYGVAIGNHTVFTKDALSGLGLIGMDLVRLGLERARSAAHAVDVITALIAQYGQGGSGYNDKDWPYHNSFLIADRRGAFLLETSDRAWAVREIADVGSASNHLTIGSNWDRLSDGVVAHAVANGWWSESGRTRFDFAGALRDTSMAPDVVSSGRHRRTCEMLAQRRGTLSMESLRSALRDHYGSPIHRPAFSIDDERYFSVCMHADPVGTTTASIIARIPKDEDDLLRCWTSLGSPCVSAFLPCYPIGRVPPLLSHGGTNANSDSPWWGFKRLLTIVERDFDRHAAQVRQHWDAFEETILEPTREAEQHALRLLRRGDHDGAAARLTSLMDQNAADMCEQLEDLLEQLSDS